MSNSKTLLLNGSPNQNGHTLSLAKKIFNINEDDRLNAYDLNVNSCDDCKVCHHTMDCKFGDDMALFLNRLKEAKTLIIVSPIYFGSLTDKIMKVINRMQMVFERKFTHYKPYTTVEHLYTVSTCGVNNDQMFEGAKRTHEILTSLLDAKQAAFLSFGGTDTAYPPLDLIEQYKTMIQQKNR